MSCAVISPDHGMNQKHAVILVLHGQTPFPFFIRLEQKEWSGHVRIAIQVTLI